MSEITRKWKEKPCLFFPPLISPFTPYYLDLHYKKYLWEIKESLF